MLWAVLYSSCSLKTWGDVLRASFDALMPCDNLRARNDDLPPPTLLEPSQLSKCQANLNLRPPWSWTLQRIHPSLPLSSLQPMVLPFPTSRNIYLAHFTGNDGAKAWVAIKGKIFDVTGNKAYQVGGSYHGTNLSRRRLSRN